MENKIKNQLELLVNREIYYDKKNFVVNGFKEISGLIHILTPNRTYSFYPKEIQEKFLDIIQDPVEEKEFVIPKSPLAPKQVVEVPKENITIKSMLLDTLEKIKSDPN